MTLAVNIPALVFFFHENTGETPERLDRILSGAPRFFDATVRRDLASHECNQTQAKYPNPDRPIKKPKFKSRFNRYASNQFRPHPRQNEQPDSV